VIEHTLGVKEHPLGVIELPVIKIGLGIKNKEIGTLLKLINPTISGIYFLF
jgi:hypothetical protein